MEAANLIEVNLEMTSFDRSRNSGVRRSSLCVSDDH